MRNKKTRWLLIGLIAAVVVFTFKTVNDQREKNLTDVIRYKPTDFLSLGVTENLNNVPGDRGFEWFSKDPEPVDELMTFLSQYKVRKVKEDVFNEETGMKKEFEFTIHHRKANPAIVFVYENGVHVLSGNYYRVIDGPIDEGWIREFNEKYKGLYGD